ncbi:IS30 family transposase [Selenomonadales bacterium OttesenSCG-928-I06]|nr:IS30 family transposase [Selenomonadales bacterium OttesenSCG-928-I06]
MQSYTHFTLTERENLRVLLEKGKSLRTIAKELGRSPSTISREIKRNKTKKGYHAWWATSLYLYRRKKCRRKNRYSYDKKLISFTQDGLSKFWSPEIITIKYKQANPNTKLSHCTIYRALIKNLIVGYSPQTHLIRRNRLKYKKGNNCTIRPDYSIHQRPKEANLRQRIGDWEVDTVHGAKGKGALLTCVDRKSRYLVAGFSEKFTAESINKTLSNTLKQNPVHTLTFDRGTEFSGFRKIQQDFGVKVFFADPHSPWQRGSNENINGLLRFFFPKGCDFLNISTEYINHVIELINTRPRKCLGWLSPHEVFFSKCCT